MNKIKLVAAPPLTPFTAILFIAMLMLLSVPDAAAEEPIAGLQTLHLAVHDGHTRLLCWLLIPVPAGGEQTLNRRLYQPWPEAPNRCEQAACEVQ